MVEDRLEFIQLANSQMRQKILNQMCGETCITTGSGDIRQENTRYWINSHPPARGNGNARVCLPTSDFSECFILTEKSSSSHGNKVFPDSLEANFF